MIDKLKNSRFALNSLVVFSGTMAASFLGYILNLAIGRMVSVEVYGEAQSLNSLVNIMLVPGMTIAMVAVKFAAKAKAEGDLHGTLAIFRFLNGKILKYGTWVFLAMLAITPQAARFLNIEEYFPLILVWVLMFLSFFSSVASGVANGWQKFRSTSGALALGALVKLIASLALVGLGFGISGIVGGMTLGFLVSYLAVLFSLSFIFRSGKEAPGGSFEKFDHAPLMRSVLPAFAGNLAMNMLANADMVLAKHSLDAQTAGQYGALTIVAKIIFFILSVIPTVLFAMSSESHYRKEDTRRTLRNAALLMLVISSCLLAAYFLFPGFILSLIFGGEYQSISSYLGYFGVIVVLFSFNNLLFYHLSAVHVEKASFSFLVIAFLMVAVLLWGGKTLDSILWIVGIFQLFAIISGLWFLFRKIKGPSS